jgi:hypothetical protein
MQEGVRERTTGAAHKSRYMYQTRAIDRIGLF